MEVQDLDRRASSLMGTFVPTCPFGHPLRLGVAVSGWRCDGAIIPYECLTNLNPSVENFAKRSDSDSENHESDEHPSCSDGNNNQCDAGNAEATVAEERKHFGATRSTAQVCSGVAPVLDDE